MQDTITRLDYRSAAITRIADANQQQGQHFSHRRTRTQGRRREPCRVITTATFRTVGAKCKKNGACCVSATMGVGEKMGNVVKGFKASPRLDKLQTQRPQPNWLYCRGQLVHPARSCIWIRARGGDEVTNMQQTEVAIKLGYLQCA
jgi:hypothetical protein